MPAKRKAAAKKETAAEGTRRSSRNASASSDNAAGAKRKASPSPVVSKRAASTKKGRTQSPSPAPDNRKSSRGRQAPVEKEEAKPAAARNTSQRGRVTRNVVQEVDSKKTEKPMETKKPTETKSRSSSRAAKSPAPQKQPSTPKTKASPKQKAVTPKQKAATPRGRSATPRQKKESPKEVSPKAKATPKPKATPKRDATPQKQKTPVTKKTPKTKPKQTKATPTRQSRSRRGKASEPEEESEDPLESIADDVDASKEKAENTEAVAANKEDTKVEEVEEKSDEVADDNEEEKADVASTEEVVGDAQEVKSKKLESARAEADQEDKPEETASAETENDENVDDVKAVEEKEEISKDEDVKDVVEEATKSENGEPEVDEEINEGDVEESMETEEAESEKVSDSVVSEDNQNDIAANNVDESEQIVEDISPCDSVEVIGDNELQTPTDVVDADAVPQKEPETVNNVSNVEEEARGSGDQVVKNNETVQETVAADLPNEDIQEKTNTIPEANGEQNVENDIVESNNQDTAAANDSDRSPTKRKFDEVEPEEEEEKLSPLKRPRLTEEPIHENGATDDVAKDYVVIEMSDVPQPQSSEVLCSLPNPIFNRPFIPNPAFNGSKDSSKHFSIASYNMLADCHLFNNDYSFTDEKYLRPEHRLNKVIEEIKYLDADILCMQEVDPDYYSNQLLPSLTSLGYDGLFKKRLEDYYKEGEATFYKTSRFTLVKSTLSSFSDLVEKELSGIDPTIQEAVRAYMKLPDVVVICKLRCNNTNQEVTVGNVHIQWGEMKLPDAQCVQITCAVKEVYRIASAVKEIVSNADGDVFPHIICGDFNSPPMSPGYLVARDGYPSGDETINKLMQIENLQLPEGKKASLVNSLWPAFQHTSSSLRSAYSEAQGYESEVSSFNRVMCDNVDYIFYSSMSLDNVGVLQMASKEKIMETGGIPNIYFPSDHVSIKSVLSFK